MYRCEAVFYSRDVLIFGGRYCCCCYSVPTCHSDSLFKFLLVGDSGTNKSALLSCFVDDQYVGPPTYINTSIGIDFVSLRALGNNKINKYISAYSDGNLERSLDGSYYQYLTATLLINCLKLAKSTKT